MAAIAVPIPARVSRVFTDQCRIRTFIVGPGGITAGNVVAITAAGRVVRCNTATGGKQQARGIALETLNEGQGVDILEEGFVAGFDLTNLGYDALVYAQDTDGALGDAGGTKVVPVGRCVPLADRDAAGNPSKVLYVRFSATTNY